jgi:hypothetical protein
MPKPKCEKCKHHTRVARLRDLDFRCPTPGCTFVFDEFGIELETNRKTAKVAQERKNSYPLTDKKKLN